MMNAVRIAEYNAPWPPSVSSQMQNLATYEDEKGVQTLIPVPNELLVRDVGAFVVDFPGSLPRAAVHRRRRQVSCSGRNSKSP